MARGLEELPRRALDAPVDLLDDARRGLVVQARDEQRRRRDLRQPLGDVPVLQRARDVELARPDHRAVDGRVLLLERECALQRLRPGIEPADVEPVERVHGLRVLRRRRRARALVRAQHGLHLGRQGGAQAVRLLDPERHARRRVRDHHAEQPGRPVEGVLEREHAAPRLAEQQVAIIDAEGLEQAGQLALEQLHRPELGRRVAQMVAAPVAELVVEHDRPARVAERQQRLEVVVRAAGAAVQQHDRRRPAGRELAAPPVPGAVPVPGDLALRVPHRPPLACGRG